MASNGRAIYRDKIEFSTLISAGILILLIISLSLLNPNFLSLNTLTNLMQQISAVGVVALGAMVVIISGGLDFTAGQGVSMLSMAAGTLAVATNNFYLFILTYIVGGMLLGVVNGLIITKLRIPPFVTTFATMAVVQGIALGINRGNMALLSSNLLVQFIGSGRVWRIPVSFIIYATVCLVTRYLMNTTKFGTYTYAIGSNEEASRNTGIAVDRYKILIYVFSGLTTGVASLLVTTRIGMSIPSLHGTMLIDAIAATAIGGTSMSGGKGTISGTIIGSVIIVLITQALTYLNISAEYQDVFKGLIILIAIVIDAFANKTVFKD